MVKAVRRRASEGKSHNAFSQLYPPDSPGRRRGSGHAFAEELFRENPGLILVSTELGYGSFRWILLTGCIGKRSDAFFAVLRNRQTRSVG
ncbi:MAG: hypothetical protein V8S22_04365 [Lachnospiraceae bacterium]